MARRIFISEKQKEAVNCALASTYYEKNEFPDAYINERDLVEHLQTMADREADALAKAQFQREENGAEIDAQYVSAKWLLLNDIIQQIKQSTI